MRPGATIGWVLSRTIEEMAKKECLGVGRPSQDPQKVSEGPEAY